MSHRARRRLPAITAPLLVRLIVAGTLLEAVAGCDLFSPEFEVRNLIERARAACDRRDADAFHAFLTDGYQDASGRSREEVLHTVTNYLLVHRQVHCVTSPIQIKMMGGKRAQAQFYAAFADQPLESAHDLDRIAADLLHLDLELATDEHGRLLVARAHWQPANAASFRAANTHGP